MPNYSVFDKTGKKVFYSVAEPNAYPDGQPGH